MIRTFIAFELPEPIKSQLGDVISAMKLKSGGVKWVQPQNLHVTLKFLGGIEEALVPRLARALDSVTENFPQVRVSLSRLGSFPDARRPRVLWAGLKGDIQVMSEIAGKVDQISTSFGMEPEKRPFRAHITIGRLKIPTVVDLSQEVRESPFTIDHIVLYKSELTPSGAHYSVLHRSVLGQDKGE